MSALYRAARDLELYQGSCLDVLASLPAESAQCCVTSPPYWGLRAYGTDEQVWSDCDHEHEWQAHFHANNNAGGGLTPKQSTNPGSYSSTGGGPLPRKLEGPRGSVSAFCECGAWRGHLGNEPLHDCLAPLRGEEPCHVCFVCHMVTVFRAVRRVLRDDGCMFLNLGDSYAADRGRQVPNSITGDVGNNLGSRVPPGLKSKDLCGIPWRVALALQADGWWLRSDIVWSKGNSMPEPVKDRPSRSHEYIFLLSKSRQYFYDAEAIAEPVVSATYAQSRRPQFSGGTLGKYAACEDRNDSGPAAVGVSSDTKNRRDVWQINTQGFEGAHFAVFPERLPELCLLAGSRPGDLVLDPFTGSGTTGAVAMRHGRRFVGCDLNPSYLAMAYDRIIRSSRHLEPATARPGEVQASLFEVPAA